MPPAETFIELIKINLIEIICICVTVMNHEVWSGPAIAKVSNNNNCGHRHQMTSKGLPVFGRA